MRDNGPLALVKTCQTHPNFLGTFLDTEMNKQVQTTKKRPFRTAQMPVQNWLYEEWSQGDSNS